MPVDQSDTGRSRLVAPLALAVLVAVLALAVLNALPAALGGEPRGVARYPSLEAVEARYGVHLWRPRALPPPLRWPPAYVRVVPGDAGWVQMVFPARGRRDWFTICQSLAVRPIEGPAVPQLLVARGDVLQANDVSLAGRSFRMKRLLLADDAIVHELWWHEGPTSGMLRLRGSVDELTKIAKAAFEEPR